MFRYQYIQQTLLSVLETTKELELEPQDFKYLLNIQQRLEDLQSKILVVGDLNAGKSTLVNSLLRSSVVPMDQQPCTNAFLELLHGHTKEIHAISVPPSFVTFPFASLNSLLEEAQFNHFKLYLPNESFLKNASLIDSPGLNINNLTTMNLFEKQQEIDIVLFVISSENHITQSGAEFLKSAQRDKSMIFFVINKFDNIKNKSKCKSEILLQLEELCHESFKNAKSLIHFISARQYSDSNINHSSINNRVSDEIQQNNYDFQNMKECLESFVVQKKMLSKLQPAKKFIASVLLKTKIAATAKIQQAESDLEAVRNELILMNPRHELMLSFKATVLDKIDSTIETTAKNVQNYTQSKCQEIQLDLDLLITNIEYGGVLFAWRYASSICDLVKLLSKSRLDHSLLHAKATCSTYIESINNSSALISEELPKIVQLTLDLHFPQNEESVEIPKIHLDFHDVYGISEQLEPLFIPGIAMAAGTYAGYATLSSAAIKATNLSLLKSSKLILMGLSILGIGVLIFSIADLKKGIQNRVKKKLQMKLQSSRFYETQSEEIAKKTRKALRGCLWEYQSYFHESFVTFEKSQKKMVETERSVTLVKNFYKDLKFKAQALEKTLSEIHIEEY